MLITAHARYLAYYSAIIFDAKFSKPNNAAGLIDVSLHG